MNRAWICRWADRHSKSRGTKYAAGSLFRWCSRCGAWVDWIPLHEKLVALGPQVRIRVPDHGHRLIPPPPELPPGRRPELPPGLPDPPP